MNQRTIEVPVLELVLDWRNPRFVDMPDQSQEAIRKRLIERENVIPLARSIRRNRGLLPGERVVVCEEGDRYVVVEGNRRICACQLLLDPSLVPATYGPMFPAADPETARNIHTMPVDIVDNRAEALRVLACRHIDGPLRWSPVAKVLFFVKELQAGKDVDQIANETGTTAGDVNEAIRDYNLLKYAFDLPCWTDSQRKQLSWDSIEPSAFLRLFRIRGAKQKLGFHFDSNLCVLPSHSKEAFDESVRLIALATLLGHDGSGKVSTRAGLEDVPGLMEHLGNLQRASAPQRGTMAQLPMELPPVPSEAARRVIRHKKVAEERQTAASSTPISGREPQPESVAVPQRPALLPRTPSFFETLECRLDSSIPEHTGILSIAKEIKTIPYRSYPNAAAMLLRCLLEQALKYHIRRLDPDGWNRLCKANADSPGLKALIRHCRSHVQSLFPSRWERLVTSVLDSKGTKDSLDLVCHQPSIVSATPTMLEGLAKGGLFALIQHILGGQGEHAPSEWPGLK